MMIKNMLRKIRRFYKKIARTSYIFYTGNKYNCPICEGYFHSFKTYRGSYFIKGVKVDHKTKNYFCPKCGSGIRHRLVMGFLKENESLLLGKRNILHFAPEESIIKYFNSYKNINYIKADVDPEKFRGAVKLDITNIELDDNSIDAIICIHVLEHINNDIKAINELYRILNDKGWLLLALPIYGEKTYEIKNIKEEKRKLQYGIEDHMRLNGLDLRIKLEIAGFEVKIVKTEDLTGNYFDLTLNTPHSESDKYLFFCTKDGKTSDLR